MLIHDMFSNEINRPINGVVKVGQADDSVVEEEIREYVITRELKKHFITFFNNYNDAFHNTTADIGVWVSGFFGSGKSHFVKMLSYILENKEVAGVKTVERFREKFADDPATFMLIDNATKGDTETILFNIDEQGSSIKDSTAVMRVFAKMFYNHLGYYGDNLKVAMLEQFLEQEGKYQSFKETFGRLRGKSWVEQRRAIAFNGKYVIPALMEVLDMSEQDAKAWFDDKTAVDFSIDLLVNDIKAYTDKKPANFRLVFIIDEVGQYVGDNLDRLLNLQSIVERLGSDCGGKVWVICTGQEAIDEIIRVRTDQFSRIQARFKTRLSMSSTSVDEVIQKRVLEKKPEATKKLEAIYEEHAPELRNLFSFQKGYAAQDIKGFSGPAQFAKDFPFIPYQFLIMQKVFAEIRKHGNSGKNLSGVERSMLSGFQEAAQKVQDQDEYTLVPFYRFYDTVHTFLDGSIRRVIERCDKAAHEGDGIEPQDVDVLKLLYLLRYIDNDIKASLDNLVILMATDIRMDKIVMRQSVQDSLDRLLAENYIGHTGDVYNFLTDEEQDIQRDIRGTDVDTGKIVGYIAQAIFGDIYPTKKCRYGNGKYDFDFDKKADDVTVGAITGGMCLQFLTAATDDTKKNDFTLRTNSGGKAIVVLADTHYYHTIEDALKIKKYVSQRNVPQLPRSTQKIIQDQQEQAGQFELEAKEQLLQAIEGAQFFVDGELIETRGDAKARIDQAMEYLVSHVYSDLNLVGQNAESEADVIAYLRGDAQSDMGGFGPNSAACAKVEEYLEMQSRRKLPTSMADIQSRYQGIPYGWRELDIALVVAQLIRDQKVTIKYAGTTIQPTDPKLPDMLRKKSETGKTSIYKREEIPAAKLRATRDFLREYFDVMDVPDDEDGLIQDIVKKFNDQKVHYTQLDGRYAGHNYPDRALLQYAISLLSDVLSQQKDNIALIDRLLAKKNDLLDSKEDLQQLEEFFRNQVTLYDSAVDYEALLHDDIDYIAKDEEAHKALNTIRLIVSVEKDPKVIYKRIPELNGLMATVREHHGKMLEVKRDEVREVLRQCMEEIHTASMDSVEARSRVSEPADRYYTQIKDRITSTEKMALLDGLVPQMWQYKDAALDRIESMVKPKAPTKVEPPKAGEQPKPPQKKVIKAVYRQAVFPAKTLESEEDIDAYVEKIRSNMKQLLKGCDGIKLN